MPATEQTWRNQRTMHIVFGVSTLVMLLTTIWMIAKDYAREWKGYQADYFQVARWSDQALLRQTQAEKGHELRALRAELREARSQPVDTATIAGLEQIVRAENERLEAAGERPVRVNFENLSTLRERLQEAADRAAEARQEASAAHQTLVQTAAAYREAQSQADANPQAEVGSQATLEEVDAARAALGEAERAVTSAEDAAIRARDNLLRALDRVTSEARLREDTYVREKKFVAATHTEKLSLLDVANAEGAANVATTLQADIDRLKERMDRLDGRIATAKSFRMTLEEIVRGDIRSDELNVQKEVDSIEQELDRLRTAIDQRTNRLGKRVVRAPILEAFDTSEMQIDNGWLPELTINYNFSDVARFDRCATCHKAIDKTAAGSATEPAYPTIQPEDQMIVLQLATPESRPESTLNPNTGEMEAPSLQSVYGFTLADRGQLDASDVTVEVVFPETAAARAGLQTGDVIEAISGGPTYNHKLVDHYLFEIVNWGRPVEITVRRGLPHPYTSHPRLDLYVGSMSPHPKGTMGCTICHDGQGSATSFKYASHTPNSPAEANEWRRDHGWFFNHHWIFPMSPRRFLESNCLKCHHEVVELEPSERFPDPPAPKLVAGWKTILDYGCYGCHEVNGYDGGRRVGPDLRSEPNYFAVAQQILRDEQLSDAEAAWARQVVHDTYNDTARNRLRVAIEADAALAADQDEATEPRLAPATHALAELLQDVENPGELRRVGPSLRFLSSKVDFAWLHDWIARPSNFRPSTKMPQFFGLTNHLDDEERVYTITGLEDPPAGEATERYTDVEFTHRMEAIEVRAITEYLLSASGEFEYLSPPSGVTEQPSAQRGQALFQTRGCLACHTHQDFPGIASDFGPDLSDVGGKFGTEKGRQWLYSWIRQPSHYHVRTKMPDLFLDPIRQIDATGQPTGAVTDPAADLVEYLVSVPSEWQPANVPQPELSDDELKALETLALEWMTASFSVRQSKEYLTQGIPESIGERLKGDERIFVGMDPADHIETTLKYVGLRSINKYGCFGCHDIPGFEGAKPIGTGLADWGRKDPSRLAFEQIHKFLQTHGIHGDQGGHGHAAHAGESHGLDPTVFDADTGFFVQAMNMHQREGFIWQKLRMPRSYDYLKTLNKSYNERLRMPQFSLTEEEREAIMTFVLGLTAETPSGQYVYQPGQRQRAIMDGKLLLTKYNCGGCHTLELERWQVAYAPDELQPVVQQSFPFLEPDFSRQEMLVSAQRDRRGMFHTELVGQHILDPQTGLPQYFDAGGGVITPADIDEEPHHKLLLYQPTLIEGQPVPSGTEILVKTKWNEDVPAHGTAYHAVGGDLTRYLFPHVVAREREIDPQANPGEVWAQLPPALHNEGGKVQTDWLHSFLLNPYAIRPAVVLRMPRFNMSDREAGQLANYFAARERVEYPYEYNERRQQTYLDLVHSQRPSHLQDAFKLLTDRKDLCAQCHSIGDFQTQQVVGKQGPNLDQAGRRLRPEYLRRWIADPPRILPYTAMPVNFGYGEQKAQELYAGTSLEQIDALVDLLTNFDRFIQEQYQISPLAEAVAREVESQQGAAQPAAAAGGE